jgi:hypothetical protein
MGFRVRSRPESTPLKRNIACYLRSTTHNLTGIYVFWAEFGRRFRGFRGISGILRALSIGAASSFGSLALPLLQALLKQHPDHIACRPVLPPGQLVDSLPQLDRDPQVEGLGGSRLHLGVHGQAASRFGPSEEDRHFFWLASKCGLKSFQTVL